MTLAEPLGALITPTEPVGAPRIPVEPEDDEPES